MRFKHARVHDAKHLDFIRSLPCVSCGDDTATEAAHLRAGDLRYGKTPTGMQEKPSDRWTLPLCSRDHRRQHQGNEIEFWTNIGVNPFVLALSLSACSGDHELAQEVISRQVHR
jgi:hypothetical protein